MPSLAKPSPSLVVAMIALCLGLGGSAFAAGALTKSQAKKVAAKQITKAAPTLSVAHAGTADKATTAASATSAVSAKTAESADSARHAATATRADKAGDADTLGGLDPNAFAAAGHNHDDRYYDKGQVDGLLSRQRFIETANGVGDHYGCTGGLAVRIENGLGHAVDDRFTFFAPGATQAWGQVRQDGSLRASSPNVYPATHPAPGVYCVDVRGDVALEAAVVSIHYN